jgi:hypothetical protein
MRTWLHLLLAAGACGGSPPMDTQTGMMMEASKMSPTNEDTFGPLEVGADYPTYKKLTDKPFQSLDHGNRWVDVYVNPIGAAAYLAGGEIPIGTIVVKTSWQNDHGRPTRVAGPIFIMEKRAPGYAPDHDDWYYAIHWAKPPPADAAKLGGPIYWRGASARAAYCWKCHDGYDRSLGGLVPSSILPR